MINTFIYFFLFLLQSNQGIKNLSAQKAHELSATDPDYSIRDLYNAIACGEFPQWNFSIQVMTFEQAEKWKYNPFDLTKVQILHFYINETCLKFLYRIMF